MKMCAEVFMINKELGIVPPLKHRLITMIKLLLKVSFFKCLPKKTAFKLMDFCRSIQGLEKKWTVS